MGHLKQAAIGFRAHSGWAVVVAVCVDRGAPVVLARQRVHLVETFTYEFRQPYHTADGELFREALLRASARCGLRDFRIREKELLDRAENVLRLKSAALMRRVTGLGRPFGAPWSQDEKFATLAAWLALATPSKSIFKELKKFSAA